MVENRYSEELRENNKKLVELQPANIVLRIGLAFTLKKLVENKELKILEIGVGEGDLTEQILKYCENVRIDCLDISSEMIESAKKYLSDNLNQINFIDKDVIDYLKEIKFKYDVITSAWTIHNFKQEDKNKTFEIIFSSLSENGKFLLMDKIYPDNIDHEELLSLQCARYKYLDEKLEKEMTTHETKDTSAEYIMKESSTIDVLKKIGFKKIKIIDRVERDLLLLAEK